LNPPVLPPDYKRGKINGGNEDNNSSAVFFPARPSPAAAGGLTNESGIGVTCLMGVPLSASTLAPAPTPLPSDFAAKKSGEKARTKSTPGLKSFGGLGALQWDATEDFDLMAAVDALGTGDWTKVAQHVKGRTAQQCMSRWVKALKIGKEMGPWTEKEDDIIRQAIAAAGDKSANVCWADVAHMLPGRLGKQCRERWQNRLDPNICKMPFSAEVGVPKRTPQFISATLPNSPTHTRTRA